MSVAGRPGKKCKRISISFNLNRFSEILDSVDGDPEKWSLKNEWREFFCEYFSNNRIRDQKNVKAAYAFYQRNKHIFKKMSHAADVACSKDKYEDDVATGHPEGVRVSKTRIGGREELLEGGSDEYLDNEEMLEPCVSEEEVSEDEGQGQQNQLSSGSSKSSKECLKKSLTENVDKKLSSGSFKGSKEGLKESSTENVDKKDECVSFEVPKSCSVKIEVKQWKEVYSGCVVNIRNEKVLPRTWSNWLAGILADLVPSCNIAFKRHKLYAATSEDIAKFWFNCTIEGCRLDSQAILDKSFCLHVNNKNVSLFHVKGKPKSFQSRYIRGEDRQKLGKSVSGMTYCSKFFHEKLNSLDEQSFSMGNLKDIPSSKNVISQCSYEYRKKNQLSESVVESVQLLKKAYNKELNHKFVPGFIQFISVDPLTIALWSEKDIELFHEMAKQHSFLVDATGTIALKLNNKEIFYFAFISFDRTLKVEPVPHIEILTDRASFNTLQFILSTFLEDEKRRYGYTTHSIPILCTTDCSWPIIKSLISSFNKETLEEYIIRSYKIALGEASVHDLPSEHNKTSVHISLCHLMKAICFKINKCFHKDKQFIKFVISLLANAGNVTDIFELCEYLFQVLLSKSNKSCEKAKQLLDAKAENIENFKKDSLICNQTAEFKDDIIIEEQTKPQNLPQTEEKYLQQSKRSIYYAKCKSIMTNVKIKKSSKSLHDSSGGISDDDNVFYSPSFATYFLDNWCGLIPLWTCLHLGDQGRHGTSSVYKMWSDKFGNLDCVINPPRTQGIIEFHQKSVKHITLNSKRERLDSVIKNLRVAKKSKLRQLEISKSRKKSAPCKRRNMTKIKDTLPSKIASEKWNKRRRKQSGDGIFQKNKVAKLSVKPLDEWEKLQVIPWGGNYMLPTGQEIRLHHTCAVDTFLEIMLIFYSLNVHQMSKLFESENPVVRKICEVIQLLLTDDFYAAKFNWLTVICGLTPDKSGLLSSFGTDKNLIMYHIRALFQRNYNFTCSSQNCPSREGGISNQRDIVDDMTLHSPTTTAESQTLLAESIKMWELGTADAAAISCNNVFLCDPAHSDFISETVMGEEVIRCSGWREPSNMSFITSPPFLVFDISVIFRETIKTLDMVPKEICVFNEKYRLCGLTSFIEGDNHYVGYILQEDCFLFYDGCPSINPVLKKHLTNNVDGDISLLFYFPYDENCAEKISKVKEKENLDGHTPSMDVSPDIISSDFLLAQAISRIENEKENIYERPKGKRYRRENTKIPQKTCIQAPCLPISSSSEASSSSESEDIPEINSELIEFIGRKKDFVRKLISDASFSSPLHTRSDRLIALHRCSSLRKFESNAIKEANIICAEMEHHIGTGFRPCEPYIGHIFREILTEWKDPNPDDICDYGGNFPVPIKIKKFDNIFKTIEYIIFPEVLIEYIMKINKITYKQASAFLYGSALSAKMNSDNFIKWSLFH